MRPWTWHGRDFVKQCWHEAFNIFTLMLSAYRGNRPWSWLYSNMMFINNTRPPPFYFSVSCQWHGRDGGAMNQVKPREQVVGRGAAVSLSQLVTQLPQGKPVRDWRKRGLLWFWQTVTRCFSQLSTGEEEEEEVCVCKGGFLVRKEPRWMTSPLRVISGCCLEAGLNRNLLMINTPQRQSGEVT